MIEAKGKNGYFRANEVHIMAWGGNVVEPQKKIRIEMYSRRNNGCYPPVVIEGPEPEIRNLMGLLYDATVKNEVHNRGGFIRISKLGTEETKLER